MLELGGKNFERDRQSPRRNESHDLLRGAGSADGGGKEKNETDLFCGFLVYKENGISIEERVQKSGRG